MITLRQEDLKTDSTEYSKDSPKEDYVLSQEEAEKEKLKTAECPDPNLPFLGVRHVQFLMIFFLIAITFAVRVNLSVGIVAMTSENSTNTNFETFDWDPQTKQLILGSLFWGYLVSQVPGSIFSKRYGAKYILAVSTFFASLLTLATPFLVSLWGWQALFVIRVLLGICQGCAFPGCETFKAKWAPPSERGSLTVFTSSGIMFGIFLTLATSGQTCATLGWPYVFYIPGVCGLLWTVCWLKFSANTPAQHGQISEAERKYIQDSLGHSADSHKNHVPTPWGKILTSIPFYALVLAFCCNNWALLLSYTESSIYINGIFNVSINSNGFLSSLPYLVRFIVEYLLIGVDSIIRQKKLMTMQFSRKFFTFIGLFGPAVCLGIFSFIPYDYLILAIIVLILSMATNAAVSLGTYVTMIDMAPNHAGILTGIMCTISGLSMNFAPLFVGMIVTDEHDQSQWQIVYVATSIILVVGCIGFMIFGSNEVQDWNDVQSKKKKIKGQTRDIEIT